MDIEAYSMYLTTDTFAKNSELLNSAEQIYILLEPIIVNNLNTIFCSRQLFLPYKIFLECCTNITDIEKKLLLVSMSCTQLLLNNGYDAIYIRTILTEYEDYIETNKTEETTSNIFDVISTTNKNIPMINNKITQGLCYFMGSVIKSSPTKPFLHFLTYKCNKCKQTFKKINDETKAKFCKCNKLELILNEPKNIISDYREILIKDNIDGIIWYNEPKLGDEIEGIGLVKMKNIGFGEYKKYIDIIFWKSMTEIEKSRNDCTMKESNSDDDINILHGNESYPNNDSATNCKPIAGIDKQYKISYGIKNENYFRSLASDENLIDHIINLVFADIYGYKNIKTAITLAFFGGSFFSQRSTIHILLIGDPGLGKSKFLNIASTLLPKSVYTCSTTATSAGLTLSCNDNENINAGCVALCNDGICCIDEFDKLKDPRVLYEVMENGTMTYNKGGMYYQINVNVSIIAASNPQGGTFSEDTNVKKNVKFENAMLNRFDLVFTMIEEFDENKMRKIIGLPDLNFISNNLTTNKENITNYAQNIENNKTENNNEKRNYFDINILKSYILYCRENISPVLSFKAKQRIKQYWIELRKQKASIQVLLTLKRLTEARAKINCREVASIKDAEFAINLYKEARVITKKKGKFLDDLRERKGEIISKDEIEEMMNNYNVKQNVDNYLEKLNYQGIIIKTGKNQYKII